MQLLHFCSDCFLYFYNVTVRITYPFLWQSRGSLQVNLLVCVVIYLLNLFRLVKGEITAWLHFCNN